MIHYTTRSDYQRAGFMKVLHITFTP